MSLAVAGVLVSAAGDAAHARGEYSGKVLVVGDDLLSGKGLFKDEDHFNVQLKSYLYENFHSDFEVVSLSQDGATSSSALALLPNIVAENPEIMILAVGYNDALRKTDTDIIYNNLDNLLKELDRAGVYVLLVGVEAPLRLDHAYATNFNNIYPKLAQRYRVVYNNGFLKGVQGSPRYTQEDRYHPNRFGITEIIKNITPGIAPMIRTLKNIAICRKLNARRLELCNSLTTQ